MGTGIYLVTGANGFVGSELVRLLCARGVRVRAMVRSAAKGKPLELMGAELVEADLRDPASLAQAVLGVEGVYHIAAVYREAHLPDHAFFEVNTEGTRQVLEASWVAGVERVVHCSTGGVLGDIKNPPGNENSPYAPDDVYQESKVAGEKTALEYFSSGRISGAVIRPGMIYGPRDTRFLKLFRAIARGHFVHIGAGKQWVHFVDVRDLVEAFVLAMQQRELSGQIYTIAGQTPLRFKEFVDQVATTLGVNRPWIHVPLAPLQWLGSLCERICKPFGISPPLYRRRVDFFAKNRYFDISKAMRELGYRPRHPLAEEIKEVMEWYRAHHLL